MSYLIDGKVVDNLKDDPEYQKAAAERQREYERNELLDRELALDEPEIGRDVMVAAAAVLKRRGIVFKDATQEQFAAALKEVSS